MEINEIKLIAENTRKIFENKKIDKSILKELYLKYNPLDNIDSFIEEAINIYPKLNCGLASLYLNSIIKNGEIINGKYKDENHTFLLINKRIVVDITSDQYGDQKVYVGKLIKPYALK